MADDLTGRRVKFNPAARPASSTDLALKAIDEGKHIAGYRTTKWYKLGENIVEVVRKGSGRMGEYVKPAYRARIVEAIPKYARIFEKLSGALGPPDVRESTKRTMKRTPSKWGGAGR